MPDNHYINPKLAALYDLDSGWSEDRDYYLSLAGQPPLNILDLGCGTGLLCNAYAAKGHQVTGVEPSSAMLDVAKQKSFANKISWVQSFAQNYQSDKLFELIIMTGHAFQVLLEDEDILETFARVKKHLHPDGKFVFESRNPSINWAREWNYDITLDLPDGKVQESRHFLGMANDRMTFELRYELTDERLVSRSELRLLSKIEIERRLVESGLHINNVLGDWQNNQFDENSSREMIFLVGHARKYPAFSSGKKWK
jgi:SAM-dependent methyltransferase